MIHIIGLMSRLQIAASSTGRVPLFSVSSRRVSCSSRSLSRCQLDRNTNGRRGPYQVRSSGIKEDKNGPRGALSLTCIMIHHPGPTLHDSYCCPPPFCSSSGSTAWPGKLSTLPPMAQLWKQAALWSSRPPRLACYSSAWVRYDYGFAATAGTDLHQAQTGH